MMEEELLSLLKCPVCNAEALSVSASTYAGTEGGEAFLRCEGCGREYPVREGIVDLLPEPSPEVLREKAAWECLRTPSPVTVEEAEAVRRTILSLPMLEGMSGDRKEVETWRRHGQAAFSLCSGVEWKGKRVLELGAGRCWLSAHLARRGARVVAVDILEDEVMGLGCGRYFHEEGVRFHRVLCDMHRLPFRDGSFDAVVATATLHHSPSLRELLHVVRRVLKPEGVLLAVNEPLYLPLREVPEEERRGAHEGAYCLWSWLGYITRSGFRLQEVRVGADASLHFQAVPAGKRLRRLPPRLIPSAVRYALLLTLALPRRAVSEAGRFLAGRPMRPAPPDRMAYLLRRVGMSPVGHAARAEERECWGPGWYAASDDELPFRWSGPRARLLLARARGMERLALETATFRPNPRYEPVEVEVKAGWRRLGSLLMEEKDFMVHRLPLRPGTGRIASRIPMAVTLRVKRGCFVPRDKGINDDPRLLGVALRAAWLEGPEAEG